MEETMENLVNKIELKLKELIGARKKLTGKSNTPSKRVLNGKINLLKEILQ